MINVLNKLLFVTLAASVICALLIAHDYENQKAANAATLVRAMAEAREAEHAKAMNRDVQKAVLDNEIRYLMPRIPATALQEIKAKPVMQKVSAKVRK